MDKFLFKKLDVIGLIQNQELVNKIRRFLIFGDMRPIYLDFLKIPDLSEKKDLDDLFLAAEGEDNVEMLLSVINAIKPEFRKEILKFCDKELIDIFSPEVEIIRDPKEEKKNNALSRTNINPNVVSNPIPAAVINDLKVQEISEKSKGSQLVLIRERISKIKNENLVIDGNSIRSHNIDSCFNDNSSVMNLNK